MITVTETASEVLGRTLASYGVGEGLRLRLARSGAGEFGLAIDEEVEGDVRVEYGEGAVVIVGAEIAGEFEGAVLDVAEVGGAEMLVLRVGE